MTGTPDRPKRYGIDWRPWASAVLTVLGAGAFAGTWFLTGDDWRALLANAGYAVGGALFTFPALYYLLTRRFDGWEWGREDHDMTKVVEDALRDPDGR